MLRRLTRYAEGAAGEMLPRPGERGLLRKPRGGRIDGGVGQERETAQAGEEKVGAELPTLGKALEHPARRAGAPACAPVGGR